jgi:hypothetical protein
MANMKFTEGVTTSLQVAPTASTGISSSGLLDMKLYEKAVIEVMTHRLPDGKGEGVGSVTVYESDVSTWSASATIITASVATCSITSASDAVMQLEVRVPEMSVNNEYKRYIGAYVAMPTSTVFTANVKRWHGSYNPQS